MELTGDRFRGEPMVFHCEVRPSNVAERVRELREQHGSIPIGVAAASEEIALQALQASADEAMELAGDSARTINAFLDRTLLRATLRHELERASASVGHNEKLAALGTLVAGVAHEINNPLGALTLAINMLELDLDPLLATASGVRRLAELGRAIQPEELVTLASPLREIARRVEAIALLADINTSIDTITRVVRDLKVFARDGDDETADVVDVEQLIDQVLRVMRRDIEQNAVLERDFAADLPPLLLPRTRLTQVITNVLINASHAVREVSRPVHRVRICTRADDEAVAISISDTGPGIAPRDVERIFDPFFTTKRQDLGTGLGLSISRSILRDLGGDLVVESVYGVGAEFILMIPLPDAAALRAAGHVSRPPVISSVHRRLSVLVVDDDDRMLRAYARALGREHNVIIAGDGDEAVALLASGTTADVVLSEIGMPGMDGAAFYEWLAAERPALAACSVFVTADDAASDARRALEAAGVPLLFKPVDRATLVEAVQRAAQRVRPR